MADTEPLRAPSAARNRDPIARVLRGVMPARGLALEIASGTGLHAAAFAAAFPGIAWQPSDPESRARASIAAWRARSGVANLRPPLDVDVLRPGWERALAEAPAVIVCINMIHIAPWSACQGLMRGAGALLRRDGALFLYGPYRRHGDHTAPSNAEFDRSLRARNPAWGVRDMEAVADCADSHGLVLDETVAMPANNFSLIFRRAASTSDSGRPRPNGG